MRRRTLLMLLPGLVLVLLAVPTTAGAYVFWAGIGTIGRVGNDGSDPQPNFIAGAEAAPIAVDADHLWYTTDLEDNHGADFARRTDLDGGEGTLLPDGFLFPAEWNGISATDGEHIYWFGSAGIGRAALDGSDAEPEFIAAPGPAMGGIAVYQGYVYWTYYNGGFGEGIGRANLSTKLVEPEYIDFGEVPEALGPRAIAVDEQGIYWVMEPAFDSPYSGNIGHAGFGGKAIFDDLPGVNAEPLGLAIVGSDLYWCNFAEGIGSSLAHAALHGGGSTVDLRLVDSACNYVAADSASGPPPPPPPPPPAEPGPAPGTEPGSTSNGGPGPTTIATPTPAAPKPLPSPKLRLNAKAGTATLTLKLPGPGTVALSGTAVRRVSKVVKAAGPVSLSARPTAKTAARLHRTGRVAVVVDLSFAPLGGAPTSRPVHLMLKLIGDRR